MMHDAVLHREVVTWFDVTQTKLPVCLLKSTILVTLGERTFLPHACLPPLSSEAAEEPTNGVSHLSC